MNKNLINQQLKPLIWLLLISVSPSIDAQEKTIKTYSKSVFLPASLTIEWKDPLEKNFSIFQNYRDSTLSVRLQLYPSISSEEDLKIIAYLNGKIYKDHSINHEANISIFNINIKLDSRRKENTLKFEAIKKSGRRVCSKTLSIIRELK